MTFKYYGKKCPVCRKAPMDTKLTFHGLEIFCLNPSCNARFRAHGPDHMFLWNPDDHPDFHKRYPGKLSLEEWERISEGGLSDDEIESRKKAEEEEKHNRLRDIIRSGRLDLITTVPDSQIPVVLKKDELCYACIDDVQLHEDRAVRYSQRGGGGTTVRVARGVYLHGGGGVGKSESQMERRHIDTGRLYLTSQRIIFTGAGRTNETLLTKIVSLTRYVDGMALSRSGKQKIEYYIGFDGNLATDLIEALITRGGSGRSGPSSKDIQIHRES